RKVDDRTLRRLAEGGVDTKRVARLAGLSVDQTRRRLQALGLLPPHRPRRLVDRHRVLALRREGLWPAEIARRFPVQAQLVRKSLWLLRHQGVDVPTPPRPRPNTPAPHGGPGLPSRSPPRWHDGQDRIAPRRFPSLCDLQDLLPAPAGPYLGGPS